ncbi:MAG TPA: hypothetical protein PLF81_03170 [Candidatus Anammoximicrobium sp.]|nr:hypothetical protein [Candidatus Anammoximicrobium sp.]
MNWKNSIVCLLLILFVSETAMAWPRVLRRRRSYTSNDVSRYGQVYDDQYLALPRASAIYDWEAIAKIDAADYIPIVLDEPLSGQLEVQLTCLSNSAETHTIKTELKDGRADVRHESIKPGTMYRLCAAVDGEQRVAGPYFTATSGSSREARGRRQIIIRYFEQYWRKENGWSYHDANCEMGYRWAIRPFAANPRYAHSGYNLADFDKDGMIHGDKCANSSHVWMALAYDEHQGSIWCIDSNFNSTIMVIMRPSASWSVGHLTADHFTEG